MCVYSDIASQPGLVSLSAPLCVGQHCDGWDSRSKVWEIVPSLHQDPVNTDDRWGSRLPGVSGSRGLLSSPGRQRTCRVVPTWAKEHTLINIQQSPSNKDTLSAKQLCLY